MLRNLKWGGKPLFHKNKREYRKHGLQILKSERHQISMKTKMGKMSAVINIMYNKTKNVQVYF